MTCHMGLSIRRVTLGLSLLFASACSAATLPTKIVSIPLFAQESPVVSLAVLGHDSLVALEQSNTDTAPRLMYFLNVPESDSLEHGGSSEFVTWSGLVQAATRAQIAALPGGLIAIPLLYQEVNQPFVAGIAVFKFAGGQFTHLYHWQEPGGVGGLSVDGLKRLVVPSGGTAQISAALKFYALGATGASLIGSIPLQRVHANDTLMTIACACDFAGGITLLESDERQYDVVHIAYDVVQIASPTEIRRRTLGTFSGPGNYRGMTVDEGGRCYTTIANVANAQAHLVVLDRTFTELGGWGSNEGGGLGVPAYATVMDSRGHLLVPDGPALKIHVLSLDADADGLRDSWEEEGVLRDAQGDTFPLAGASASRKDVFVEVDCMAGNAFLASAQTLVGGAYANMRVKQSAAWSSDSTTGPVALHFDVDAADGALQPASWEDSASLPELFAGFKQAHFGSGSLEKGDSGRLRAKRRRQLRLGLGSQGGFWLACPARHLSLSRERWLFPGSE